MLQSSSFDKIGKTPKKCYFGAKLAQKGVGMGHT